MSEAKTNYEVFSHAYYKNWGGFSAGLRALGLDPDATGGVQALRDEIDELKARKPQVEVPGRVRRLASFTEWLYADAEEMAAFIRSLCPRPTRLDRLVSRGLTKEAARAACEELGVDPGEVVS